MARLPQQSHHCGIETPQKARQRQPHLSSNRTIVGLKQVKAKVKVKAQVKQQSHHCGIETNFAG